jgi:hypothetical protein
MKQALMPVPVYSRPSSVVQWILAAVLVYLPALSHAAASKSTTPESAVAEPSPEQLDDVVKERRNFYNTRFPDISFVFLKGGSSLLDDMMALSVLLRHDPKCLDYEHPRELRREFYEVTIERIQPMLWHRAPSATLFQPVGNSAQQPALCVITLDPCFVSGDDLKATKDLLNIPDTLLQEVSVTNHLACVDYLTFVLDHEVFHCLDSYYNGPMPMSMKKYWGEYMF